MAKWTNITSTLFEGAHSDYDYGDSKDWVRIYLQYDADSVTVTSMKIRFLVKCVDSAYYQENYYYMLINPGTSNEILKLIKTGTRKWDGIVGQKWTEDGRATSSITLTKAHNAKSFTIPAYWMCNTGSAKAEYNETKKKWYITYADKGTQTFYWYFTNNRKNFKQVVASTTTTTGVKYTTAIGNGTVSITDNGNNTFTLKGAKGKSGTNNTASGPTLTWGYDTKYKNTFKNGETKTLTLAKDTDASRTVYAKCVTTAAYGNNTTVTDSQTIKYYAAPGKPGKAAISFTKSKLTIKENWTISWTAAKKANGNSAIKGYLIRVFVNGKSIAFKGKDGDDPITKSTGKGDDWENYYDQSGTGTSMTFYPAKNGIKPGDKIKIAIHAYTKNGAGTRLYSDYSMSDEVTVKHAGIMNVKVNGTWKEGQVWVKVSGAWKEAEAVYTKVSGAWKESI